jgi:hypothetical protein
MAVDKRVLFIMPLLEVELDDWITEGARTGYTRSGKPSATVVPKTQAHETKRFF